MRPGNWGLLIVNLPSYKTNSSLNTIYQPYEKAMPGVPNPDFRSKGIVMYHPSGWIALNVPHDFSML